MILTLIIIFLFSITVLLGGKNVASDGNCEQIFKYIICTELSACSNDNVFKCFGMEFH